MNKTLPPPFKRRSNIELLRALCMLFILMVHSNYMGTEALYDRSYDAATFLRFFIEAVAIVGVNCFVLISGYFGIRLRKENVASLLFQTYFFSLLGLGIYVMQHGVSETSASIYARCLFPSSNYIWFLPCYLLLMLFSPILNEWLRRTPVRRIAILSGIIYAVTYYWSVVWKHSLGFGGYSFGFFILLYIVGHLIRRFQEKDRLLGQWACIGGYWSCVALLMFISFMQHKVPVFKSLLWSYDCPVVLLESICLFIVFVKMEIRSSKLVNWIGRSCFAVLLVHIAPSSTYASWLQYVDENYSGGMVILMSLSIMLAYYIAALLMDQVRLFAWNRGLRPLFAKGL